LDIKHLGLKFAWRLYLSYWFFRLTADCLAGLFSVRKHRVQSLSRRGSLFIKTVAGWMLGNDRRFVRRFE
jgi:hypothetical protein